MTKKTEKIRELGLSAGLAGLSRDKCPYSLSNLDKIAEPIIFSFRMAWLSGYDQGIKERQIALRDRMRSKFKNGT